MHPRKIHNSLKTFFQPRITVVVTLTEHLNINFVGPVMKSQVVDGCPSDERASRQQQVTQAREVDRHLSHKDTTDHTRKIHTKWCWQDLYRISKIRMTMQLIMFEIWSVWSWPFGGRHPWVQSTQRHRVSSGWCCSARPATYNHERLCCIGPAAWLLTG